MKKEILALFLLWTALAFSADTLEVFALRVEFQEEKPDNSLTTGTGLFDSDSEAAKSNYSLDPQGRRASSSYWKKHFDFANEYFKSVSAGNLVLKYRFFPETGSAYKLDKFIIDYNRTNKRKDEKTAEYDEARSRDYMSFIWDAVQKAHQTAASPFSIPLSEHSNTKRAYMIIHAGASRLVDGGSMGTTGANTPGDFMDVFVSSDFWTYLPDSLAKSSHKEGIVLPNAVIDTLKEVMVLSETASQDGLNWGVNGIIINQIGRFLGMPNTYDIVKGISRLGYFDVMDFAGYNAGNGFFPVLPSAWVRAYMGWANVKEVFPTEGKSISFDLAAAGTGIGVEILKIPLNASEYLLIENRQRSWQKDGTVEVLLSDADTDDPVLTTKKIPIDSLYLVFEDSVCVKGTCSVNKKKAEGIIVGINSFDAALPSSGIVVWKVNEWYLREALPYGVVNFWGGDTLRDHQFGLSVIEADGLLSIGKTFKNALGQNTYDYGSGTDMLPHVRFNKDTIRDTVTTIRSTGYANTASTNGGLSGLQITAKPASTYRREKTESAFTGDSVLNFGALTMSVTLSFEDEKIPSSKFPKTIGYPSIPRGAVVVDYPSSMLKTGERALAFGSADGTLQILSAYGEPLMLADTALSLKTDLTKEDLIKAVPLYRLGQPKDSLVGLASQKHFIFSAHRSGVLQTELVGLLDEVQYTQKFLPVKNVKAGPLLTEDALWVASDTKFYNAKIGASFAWIDSVSFPKNFKVHDMALCQNEGDDRIAFVGADAALAIWSTRENKLWSGSLARKANADLVSTKDQYFRLSCTDFNRDGTPDLWVLGSHGFGAIVSADSAFTVVAPPRQYKRGADETGASYHEISSSAISDLNGDGYPDVVFLGYNRVYAIDHTGVPLDGFPAIISNGLPEYGLSSDPLILDVSGDKAPDILVGTTGGLLLAFTAKGKKITSGFPLSAGSFEYGEFLSPMSILVADAIDSLSGPELYAFHRESVSGFRLYRAASDAEKSPTAWSVPGNGNKRTNWFDASLLKTPETKRQNESISEFYIYPNPVKGGVAKSRFTLGMDAKSAWVEFYDITGLCVYKKKIDSPREGKNEISYIDLSALGSDVYSVRLKVQFVSGKEKTKIYRVGVIR